jgi:uncharacterized membrane protein
MSRDTLHTLVLAVHVISGSLGLALGPAVMLLPKRRGLHTRLGKVYQWATAGLCVSALGLVALHTKVWGLAIIAAATEITALGGLLVARRRRGNWVPLHLSLMCGSYISFVTAFFVVNLGRAFWPAWIVPTIIGSPLIARAAGRVRTAPHASTVPADPNLPVGSPAL